jgi:hypothetical protein
MENGKESTAHSFFGTLFSEHVAARYILDPKRVDGYVPSRVGEDLWTQVRGLSVLLVVELKDGTKLTARLISEAPYPRHLCDLMFLMSLD